MYSFCSPRSPPGFGFGMPVTVRKGSGPRPWKIVEKSGRVVGTSKTKAAAEASARARNAAHREKTRDRGRGVRAGD